VPINEGTIPVTLTQTAKQQWSDSRCSVCRKQQDVSRFLGNSYGLVCCECLVASGDLED
jgi:hypothetical protein